MCGVGDVVVGVPGDIVLRCVDKLKWLMFMRGVWGIDSKSVIEIHLFLGSDCTLGDWCW